MRSAGMGSFMRPCPVFPGDLVSQHSTLHYVTLTTCATRASITEQANLDLEGNANFDTMPHDHNMTPVDTMQASLWWYCIL